jgi:hypothetical protein
MSDELKVIHKECGGEVIEVAYVPVSYALSRDPETLMADSSASAWVDTSYEDAHGWHYYCDACGVQGRVLASFTGDYRDWQCSHTHEAKWCDACQEMIDNDAADTKKDGICS